MTASPATDLSGPTWTVTPVAWALAGAVTILPFLSHLPIDFDRLAPLALLPALWLSRNLDSVGPSHLRAAQIDRMLMIVWISVALISAGLSPHLAPALVHSAATLRIVAGALLARRLAGHPGCVRLILGGISSGAALGCLVVWAGWKQGTPMGDFPHYGHVRLFGLHMMIGMMSALAWRMSTTARTVERHAVTLLAITACGGMLWSGGRTPLLGAAAGLIVWFWKLDSAKRRELVRAAAVTIFGGLILSVLRWSPEPYLGWWGAIARSTAATSIDELSSTRLSFWQVAWHEFLQAPWIGHGADFYRFIQPKQDGSQPHNWPLQFLLDFGILGGVALGLLLLRQAWRGLFGLNNEPNGKENFRLAAGAIFLACLTSGLLDGVFYHAILLLPAALVAGLAGNLPSAEEKVARKILLRPVIWAGMIAASLILVLHEFIFAGFLQRAVPASPETVTAQVLRSFPSATFGLNRWLNTWKSQFPEETLEWAHWAQAHSDNAAELHVYTAVLYSNQGDFASASAEMEAALQKAHVRARPKMRDLQRAIANAAQAATRSPP